MAIELDLKNRDIALDDKKHFAIADKTKDIKQRLILKIELMKGEWYLNKDEGIPWLEIFSLTGSEQEQMAKNEIKKVLIKDKAVVEIKKLTAKQNIKTNVLEINFIVLCTDGNEYTIEIRKRG